MRKKTKADLEKELVLAIEQGRLLQKELEQNKIYLDTEKLNNHRLGIQISELNRQLEQAYDSERYTAIELDIVRRGALEIIKEHEDE